ncbi:hypothetical protein [Pseudomonas sp. G2-4]|uniref:hypothetical protein n=1 Tax=Pseudomonas sp. G2-4 TaxID=1506334 RepID=UPI0024BB7047|nr:hypothetical protein [Pseudomonas sp. G2-4]WHS60968.1 hypothetical protein QNH97_02690 [Pseudomonas sp. G2-4]
MRPRQSSFWKVFGIPVVIGVLSAAGLFSALLGDGAWDAVAWVGLGVPTALGTWGLLKRG